MLKTKNYSKWGINEETPGVSLGHCQLLRSGGEWSIGLTDGNEVSIYNAYIQQINAAERLIFIENQFFVSSTPENIVGNRLAEVLIEKIIQKIQANEDFLVVIF
jgi:phospholipase D1/2